MRKRAPLNNLRRGVVMCDAELPDGSWKTALNELASKAVPMPLIVASRLADDKLWAEVLNLGGRMFSRCRSMTVR